jgi:hypothetical protein
MYRNNYQVGCVDCQMQFENEQILDFGNSIPIVNAVANQFTDLAVTSLGLI